MKTVNPYLNFNGNTEEAFTFYRSVFSGEFLAVIRFKDFGENHMDVPENELNKIAHIALPLGKNNILMGTDKVKGKP
jgi:PhnB protein